MDPELNYMWPKKGDRLLRPSNDWYKASSFSDDASSRHVVIWTGYLRACERLIDICNSEPGERNFLIYPILFNYRHGIEMAMKWIVSQYGSSAGLALTEPNHDLWHLWQCCRKIFRVFGDDPEGTEGVVEKIVKELHDLDKVGTSFRYSVNRDGTQIELPESLVDLSNLRKVTKSVARFLTGTDAWLQDLTSYDY
jgi:hypothetical protein